MPSEEEGCSIMTKPKPRPRAPDGNPYPPPIVAVSQEEQLPWGFGWAAAEERARDRSIVHALRLDPASQWTARGNAPFYLVSANLHTADYWLVGPDGPRDGFAAVERKERDLASTLTTHHDRFIEECDRLRSFYSPLIVCSQSVEVFLDRNARHAASMLGTMMVIASRYRIPFMPLPNRSLAERFAGDFLRDCWERALAVDEGWLKWAREWQAGEDAKRSTVAA